MLSRKLNRRILNPQAGETYKFEKLVRSPTCRTCSGTGFSRSGPKNYFLKCVPCQDTGLDAVPWSELFRAGRVENDGIQ